MELGSRCGRVWQGLRAVLGWQCSGACAWQASMVKELQSWGLRSRRGVAGLACHVGEASRWVGSGGALRVMLG